MFNDDRTVYTVSSNDALESEIRKDAPEVASSVVQPLWRLPALLNHALNSRAFQSAILWFCAESLYLSLYIAYLLDIIHKMDRIDLSRVAPLQFGLTLSALQG